MWNGLSWARRRANGGAFWTDWWTFEFNNRRKGMYGSAEALLISALDDDS
jgi:hypothetical protein